MFDLNAGVHFQKVKILACIDEKLNCAGADVVYRFGCFDCDLAHLLTEGVVNRGGRRFFNHFLIASLQRRNQKVIEESPSTAIKDALREQMGQVAVEAAKAVNYVGAGTVEFLVDAKQNFYFLEMNTRIQVEHPVTELVTGVDLVKAQIEIAAGEHLSLQQQDIQQRGWAIECRIYAEDPTRNFSPSPGKIEILRTPGGNGVRDDGGVYEGWDVPIYYDPMISKLCAYGRTRDEAIQRMLRALQEYTVEGIITNIPFHRWALTHPRFLAGDLDTGFIPQEFHGLP